jgi:alkylation response protein AidB-like acyl-CoA dehydrogenase
VDFKLSDEQRLLQRTVREFAEKEIAPFSREWDEKQEFPRELFGRLGGLGLMGAMWPVEYGGAALSTLDFALVLEELSRVDAGVALSVAAHNSLCSGHIFLAGSREQKRVYLSPLARGEHVGCWALTESGAGSDAAGTQTTAKRDAGGWVLNGSKTFITNGGLAETAVVLAVTDKSKGKSGISAFIVERGTEGFRPGRKEDKLGVRCSDTSQLFFEDCRVPEKNLLGEEGHGFLDALHILDEGRVGIAAFSVGIAQASLEAATAYAGERKQFGRPIGDFQATRLKLADMATKTEAARLLTRWSAWLRDSGEPFGIPASMAKLYASEAAVEIAMEAVQIHGGYGYTKEYAVERYLRDSKLGTIGEGTSEVQRLVIARQLLGPEGKKR